MLSGRTDGPPSRPLSCDQTRRARRGGRVSACEWGRACQWWRLLLGGIHLRNRCGHCLMPRRPLLPSHAFPTSRRGFSSRWTGSSSRRPTTRICARCSSGGVPSGDWPIAASSANLLSSFCAAVLRIGCRDRSVWCQLCGIFPVMVDAAGAIRGGDHDGLGISSQPLPPRTHGRVC